ncbi:phage tail protein [Gracilibacillus oryzae]|uniref:Phage tail protein n=1 Tax=Gracilibacillus oryzae TaxID=1672701 RepID=A0A7C8KPW6_9BACI|nr:phage tail protein [Gracilibacillus oryzae]KAB8126900.1 phage tail protein [Gracilibacillus oryzae]
MAKIGTYGEIVFEVSDKRVQTFRNLERSGSGRWSDHEVSLKKPKSEFTGPGLEELNFQILLKAELGVNPSKQLEILRVMRDTGQVAPFILGGRPISVNHWSLPYFTESYRSIDPFGNILIAEVNINLKEYRL